MSSFDSCSWSWIYKTVARLLQYYYYYALVGERDSMESFVFMEIQNNFHILQNYAIQIYWKNMYESSINCFTVFL